jgi:hypothetical protein
LSATATGNPARVAERVAWWLAWFAVAFWLWLAFVGEWDGTERAAAALAGCAFASVALLVREQCRRFRARLGRNAPVEA